MERRDGSPASHLESTHRFLDRVSGAYWSQVRDELAGWVTHVEIDDRRDLIARLRSSNDDQFSAAYLELFLHEMFLRSGYSVECHPGVGGGTRRPDFRVDGYGRSFYVEARHLVRSSDKDVGRDRRTAAIYDALNTMDSPNFFVWVDVNRSGPNEIPKRDLVASTESWLASLDPDAVDDALRPLGLEGAPSRTWSLDGWTVQLRAIPKALEARGEPGVRPIGIYGGTEAQFVDGVTPIRDALRSKGTAYDITDSPFIVALGVDWFTGKDDRDMMCALYGSDQIVIDTEEMEAVGTQRSADGYWYGGDRWAHTNVSGVLQVTNLHPAFFHESNPTLWLHPCADNAIDPLPSWRCLDQPDPHSATDLRLPISPNSSPCLRAGPSAPRSLTSSYHEAPHD